MQHPKTLIESLHLLTVWTRIIRLFPVPNFLALPLPHRLRRHGLQVEFVDQTCDAYRGEGREDCISVVGVQDTLDAGGDGGDRGACGGKSQG